MLFKELKLIFSSNYLLFIFERPSNYRFSAWQNFVFRNSPNASYGVIKTYENTLSITQLYNLAKHNLKGIQVYNSGVFLEPKSPPPPPYQFYFGFFQKPS